jgi:hypothetical protein
MKRIIVLIIHLVLLGKVSGQDGCDQILRFGVFETYGFKELSDIDRAVESLKKYKREDVVSNRSSVAAEAGVALGFIDIGLGGSSSNEEYQKNLEEISEYYRENIKDKTQTEVFKKIASPDIIKAWSECKESTKDFNLQVNGNLNKEFIVTLTYKGSGLSIQNTKITSALFISVDPVDNGVFKTGTEIRIHNVYSQKFRRSGSDAATIVLNLENFPKPISLEIPAIPPPAPVWEMVWIDKDENGNPLYMDFAYNVPGSTTNSPHDWQKTYVVNVKNAVITKVEYSCVGNGCGWCYSRAGGYALDANIDPNAPNKFVAGRHCDGQPCTITHRAFYKVKSARCIKNCD